MFCILPLAKDIKELPTLTWSTTHIFGHILPAVPYVKVLKKLSLGCSQAQHLHAKQILSWYSVGLSQVLQSTVSVILCVVADNKCSILGTQ